MQSVDTDKSPVELDGRGGHVIVSRAYFEHTESFLNLLWNAAVTDSRSTSAKSCTILNNLMEPWIWFLPSKAERKECCEELFGLMRSDDLDGFTQNLTAWRGTAEAYRDMK